MLEFIDRQTAQYNKSAQQLNRFRAIVRFHNVMRFADDMMICFNVHDTARRLVNETTDKAEDLMVQYFNHVNKNLLKKLFGFTSAAASAWQLL